MKKLIKAGTAEQYDAAKRVAREISDITGCRFSYDASPEDNYYEYFCIDNVPCAVSIICDGGLYFDVCFDDGVVDSFKDVKDAAELAKQIIEECEDEEID